MESKSVIIKCPVLFLNFKIKKPKIPYYIIYKTTNLLKNENDKNRFYIGKHIQYNSLDFDGYLGSGSILNRSIMKYGVKNFKREILEVCNTKEEMESREIYWIEYLHANITKYPNDGGMNQNTGGLGGCTFNCNFKGENNPMYGRNHSQETRKVLSKLAKERFSTPENNYMFGRTGELSPMYGKKHSKEWCDNIKKGQDYKELKLKRSLDVLGERNVNNKCNFTLSNGENYWTYFSAKERNAINDIMRKNDTNKIIFKDVEILRELKEGMEFNKLSEETKKRISESGRNRKIPEDGCKNIAKAKQGLNNPRNKFNYILSNGKDYWEFFNGGERAKIRKLMKQQNVEVITFKDITIQRVPKELPPKFVIL
jgi:hypothetical protein